MTITFDEAKTATCKYVSQETMDYLPGDKFLYYMKADFSFWWFMFIGTY